MYRNLSSDENEIKLLSGFLDDNVNWSEGYYSYKLYQIENDILYLLAIFI